MAQSYADGVVELIEAMEDDVCSPKGKRDIVRVISKAVSVMMDNSDLMPEVFEHVTLDGLAELSTNIDDYLKETDRT